MIVDSRS